MKSRKNASSSIQKQSSSSGYSTTAAAVSVTKFGQATFTSFRRKEGNENSKFVPLKKSKLDSDDCRLPQKPIAEQTQLKTIEPPKPKVYKFFKSRASADSKPTTTNDDSNRHVSRSTPQPLVLNNYSKHDGIKRITTSQATYTRIKNERTNTLSSPLIHKSINLNENKSCEIKILGDKTIKKIISPNKTTEFIIRNRSSNVRNATVKPNINTTPVQILPSTRGIRSSRRLRGVDPDLADSASKISSTIHLTFDKKPVNPTKKLTTTIDIVDESVRNEEENEEPILLHENVLENNKNDPKLSENDENFQQVNGNRHDSNVDESIEPDPTIENVENQNPATIDSSIKENSIQSINDFEKFESEPLKKCIPTPEINEQPPIEKTETLDKVDQMEEEKSSENSTVADVQPPLNENINDDPVVSKSGEQVDDGMEQNKIENKSSNVGTGGDNNNGPVVAKPKKKIFSNRGRNKIEFNTKSFFSSDLKDEFDMEMDNNPSNANNAEKKTIDNDEDDNYIKLKRIKKAHQCHELGETEQFDEDIKYYLSGIVSSNPISMRCLSIVGLTQQTMRPEFRMHLRAHDDMPRIIKALMDAPKDPNMALCTACLMFVYNQDRLTMDIDPNALSLMLELLETRSDECNQVEERHRSKVKSLVEEMKNKGHSQYLKLNEITAGKLAMETLLGLTSKRAGDWFKVELRKMKGIDFIVNAVIRCAEDQTEEEGQMVKIDRCMHVLENVTFNNVENQLYITNYNDSKFISTCISLLIECKHKIISSNDSKIFLSAFFSILRVFTNLTSESVEGCKNVGTLDGVIDLLLESLFELPTFIMSDQRFDLMVIILCLCINLAEFCGHIRAIIMDSKKYMSKLCELLFKKIEEAEQVEQQTDHLLESHETVQMTEAMQDNLLMQMISKSGTHMEHSLLSAAVCLLFGCCIQDNDGYKNSLKEALPNNSFKPLIEQLEKLRDFAHLADIMTQKGKERVQKVLQMLKLHNSKSQGE